MAEIADDMANGAACELCCVYFTKEHGYPVLCDSCWSEGSVTQKAIFPELGGGDEESED